MAGRAVVRDERLQSPNVRCPPAHGDDHLSYSSDAEVMHARD
jgi:hypothetical protein